MGEAQIPIEEDKEARSLQEEIARAHTRPRKKNNLLLIPGQVWAVVIKIFKVLKYQYFIVPFEF